MEANELMRYAYELLQGHSNEECARILREVVAECQVCNQQLKAISPVFEEDVFDAISMETCVSTRCTVGAPSKTSMDKVIAVYDEYMKSNWQDEV